MGAIRRRLAGVAVGVGVWVGVGLGVFVGVEVAVGEADGELLAPVSPLLSKFVRLVKSTSQ
jgi:hypothetical protein